MAFSSLPPELLAMILSYLPIRRSLIAVGLSSSVLAGFIFESLSFAQRHYLHQRQTTGASSIWHFMRSEGLVWQEWKSLPLSYQAALYRELLHADKTKKEEQFLNLFNGQVWNLGPTKALKIMQSLISEKAVSPSCQSNRAIHWAVINGHVEVVKLLLLEKTLGFSQDDDEDDILLEAIWISHVEIVKVLLNDPRIYPPQFDANFALHARKQTLILSKCCLQSLL
ncbi:hypothetical protein BDR26DRAFT_870776 [Obelidium mucronatum]|nr:hypothetical protein BDR26DRAFT_870776 [Obelidium mucronatum]